MAPEPTPELTCFLYRRTHSLCPGTNPAYPREQSPIPVPPLPAPLPCTGLLPSRPRGGTGRGCSISERQYEESEILPQLTIISANDLDYSLAWHRNQFSRLALRQGSAAAPALGKRGLLPVAVPLCVMGCAPVVQIHVRILSVSHSSYSAGTEGVQLCQP